MSSRLVEPRTDGDRGELVAAPPVKGERRSWRSVAVPSEHGGWGLTIEPGLLGLLVAPSIAGVCLAVAAVGAFLARTPFKAVAVDRRRRQMLARTVLARRVAAGELVVIGLLVAGAVALVVLVVVQRGMARRPVTRAVKVGVRQMVMGFALVAVAAVGVLAASS